MSALSVNAFTVNGISYRVINELNKWVEIAPQDNGSPYTNVTTSKLTSTVTNNGKTYQVVGIGPLAFSKATWESILQLPEGLVYIDSQAFREAQGLSLKIAASVKLIATDAFLENKIHGFTVIADNTEFANLAHSDNPGGSMSYLTDKNKTKILAAPGARAKSYSSGGTTYVSQIVIPEQITEIGDYAFYGNKHFTSITLHKGIKKYGHSAFFDCVMPSITLTNPDAEMGSNLFAGCDNLSSVTLPTGIKVLPSNMFFVCEKLTRITLPEGLVKIGKMCFAYTGLTSINLPESLEVLDTCALQYTAITSINLKNVKSIGNMCFSGCENLTTITGNNKLEEMGSASFTRCDKLTKAYLPEGLQRMLGGSYFRCAGIVDATMPSTVEHIERNPFVGCTALKEIKVADGNEKYAEIDSCLYEMNDDKPYRLVGVPSARLNKVVRVLPGTRVLAGQAMREVDVTELYMGKDIDSIGSSAFSGCNAFTKVEILAPVPPVGGDFTEAAYANATLYVPMKSVDAYKAADGWKLFKNIVGVDVPDEGIKGDVNSDGVVDVSDVNELINRMLNYNDDPSGDVTGDGTVDVSDINEVINIILGN